MYHRNFLFLQYPDSCFTAGKSYTVEVPRPGKYKVVVTLKADSALEKVSIYAGAGNLAFAGSIPAGLSRQVAVVHVGNHIPEGQECVCQDRTVSVTVLAEKDCLSGLYISEISCPTLYIAGSSGTASSQSFPVPENPDIKWKHMLSSLTNHKIAVSDYSCPGLSMDSFRKKGLYAAITEYSRPGDFCLFQFDPIGQTAKDWTSGGICRRQLVRYLIECRNRFMYPILLTPAACHDGNNRDDYYGNDRDDHDGNGRDNHTGQLYKQCLDAYREAGKLTATPVIEQHKLYVTPYDAYVAAESVAKEIARVCMAYPRQKYLFPSECMGIG